MDRMAALTGGWGQHQLPITTTTTHENQETTLRLPQRRTTRPAEEEILAIYEDPDSRDSSQRPFREYYGDNVPVLAQITNGQDCQYQKRHNLVRDAAALKQLAVHRGDVQVYDVLCELERQERVSLDEMATGFYEWTPLQSINNVWLWIAAHNYQARWTFRQQEKFRDLLAHMSAEVLWTHNGSLTSCEVQAAVEDMCRARLAALRIDNVAVQAQGPCTYRFYPVGESKPQHRLSDFPEEDRWDVQCLYYNYLAKEDRPVQNHPEGADPWNSLPQGDASAPLHESAASPSDIVLPDADDWDEQGQAEHAQHSPPSTESTSPSTQDPSPSTQSTQPTPPPTQGSTFFADLSFFFPAMQRRSGSPVGPMPMLVDEFADVRRLLDEVNEGYLDDVADGSHRRRRPRTLGDQSFILGELQYAVAVRSLDPESLVRPFGSMHL